MVLLNPGHAVSDCLPSIVNPHLEIINKGCCIAVDVPESFRLVGPGFVKGGIEVTVTNLDVCCNQ